MATDLETYRANLLAGAIARAESGVEAYPTEKGQVQLMPFKELHGLLGLLGVLSVPNSSQSATTYAEVVT